LNNFWHPPPRIVTLFSSKPSVLSSPNIIYPYSLKLRQWHNLWTTLKQSKQSKECKNLLFNRWGRSPVLHLTNIIYIVCTFSAMLVADNYFWLMALVAMGSTFPPLGIRLAYTLGKRTMSFRFLLQILLT